MRYSLPAALFALSVSLPTMAGGDITLGSGVTVAPGESKVMPVNLASPAASGVFVTLSSSDPSRVTINPANLYIPAGATTPYLQPKVTGVNFGSANIAASAFGLSGDSQMVRVAAALFGPANATINRGITQDLMFTLSAPTPTALTILLASDNPSVAGVPASVTIPANGTTAVVPVTGVGPGSTIIRVSSPPNVAEKVVNVTVVAPASIMLSNITAGLGRTVPFPVTLGTPAPAGGVTVTLASSRSLTVSVSPSGVFIPAGSTTPATQPQVTGVNIGVATITASAPGYVTASQEVSVPATINFSPTALTLAGPGSTTKLLLALSDSAPWGPESSPWGNGAGVTIQLTSSNPNVVRVPLTVDLYPDGSEFTTVVIVVTAVGPGSAVIRAGAPPFIPEITASVTVLGSGSGTPASIAATSGTPQSTAVNTAFGAPLVATVRDSGNNPVPGALVTFTAPLSGPSGFFAGGVNTAVTNGSGVATSAVFTANSTPGIYVVSATVSGIATPANFVLTNTSVSSGAITLPGNVVVGPNQTVTFPVSLTVPAPPGGVNVMLTSSDTSKLAVTPPSVFIAAGSTSAAVQPQVTGINFGTANISGSAAGYASASQPVNVSGTLSFSPSNVTFTGTGTHNLALILSSPAPGSGLTVSLNSSNPGVAAVLPTAFFAPNTTSVNVPVTGAALGSVIISANSGVPNLTGATANVMIAAGRDITLGSGVTVAPGESKIMPVNLASPSAGGVFVTLSSSDTSKATINPANLYIPAGATAPYVQPRVTGVNFGSANIAASAFGLSGDSQMVRVAATLFGPANATINRGVTQNLMFTLSAPTPTALMVMLTSDNPSVAAVPASVTIPAHGTSAVVPVTGAGAGSTIIRVSSPPNIAEKAVNVTVVAPGSITLPSVSASLGTSVPFPVTLGTPAPAGGVTVTLVSSRSLTVSVSPSSVFIPGGSTAPTTQPQVTGVNIGVATITASAPGYVTASQEVPVPATISFSPTALILAGPGSTTKLLLALSDSAPWGPESSPWGNGAGVTIQLTSSNPNVVRVPPTVDLYPDGSEFTTVVIVVTAVGPGSAVIRAGAPPFIPEISASVTVGP